MRVAYVRVSTAEQNEERQLEALEHFGIERWYTEKVSGKNTNRQKLQEMLDFVREGDVVYVHDLSRLARSTKDLLSIVEQLDAKKVQLVSNKEAIDTQTAAGKLMLTMIGAIAEFERQNLLERQREGIEIAKRAGKYRGGHTKEISPNEWQKNLFLYKTREINKRQFAERLHISRPTLDKLLRKEGERNDNKY